MTYLAGAAAAALLGGGCTSGAGPGRGAAPAPPPRASAAPTSAPPASARAAPVSFDDLRAFHPPPPPSRERVFAGFYDLTEAAGSPLLQAPADAVKKQDWSRAKRLLAEALPKLDKATSLDAWLAAHTLLGRAHAASGDAARAAAEYELVRAAWQDTVEPVRLLRGDDQDDTLDNRTVRAVCAVGEALFFFAEKKRRETVDALTMPVYKGKGVQSAVLAFIASDVSPWVGKRQAAANEAEKEYHKIADLQPFVPLQWFVEAASACGSMWVQFDKEFHDPPMPDTFKAKDAAGAAARAFLNDTLDAGSAPIKQRAREAFTTCAGVLQKHPISTPAAKACTDWLAANPAPGAGAP